MQKTRTVLVASADANLIPAFPLFVVSFVSFAAQGQAPKPQCKYSRSIFSRVLACLAFSSTSRMKPRALGFFPDTVSHSRLFIRLRLPFLVHGVRRLRRSQDLQTCRLALDRKSTWFLSIHHPTFPRRLDFRVFPLPSPPSPAHSLPSSAIDIPPLALPRASVLSVAFAEASFSTATFEFRLFCLVYLCVLSVSVSVHRLSCLLLLLVTQKSCQLGPTILKEHSIQSNVFPLPRLDTINRIRLGQPTASSLLPRLSALE